MRHRKGDDNQRGSGGKIPGPGPRYRVSYTDENGEFQSITLGSALHLQKVTEDLDKRKLRYKTTDL